MKAREFCYWLQGMFELNPPMSGLNAEQTRRVKNHLDMVFIHDIDPTYPEGEELDAAHNSGWNGASLDDTPPQFKPQKPGAPVMRC